MAGSAPSDAANRSKAQQGRSKKRKGGPASVEEIGLNAAQAEHVKHIRVDTKRDPNYEDPHVVQLSKVGKAPQLQLSEDRLSVTGYKGFRTARCSHGVHEGTWYCEVTIQRLGSTGHARVGWCTKKAELQAPVGYDTFGYCYRDLEGSKVTAGKREAYGQPFKEGDVVGMLIHMPPGGRCMETVDRNVSRFKGNLYYIKEPEVKAQALPGSSIVFSVNGVSQGEAYGGILEGTYYPAVSLFTLPEQTQGASVTVNFGPHFKYPAPQVEGQPPARAMVERASIKPEPGAGPMSAPGPVASISTATEASAAPADTAANLATVAEQSVACDQEHKRAK